MPQNMVLHGCAVHCAVGAAALLFAGSLRAEPPTPPEMPLEAPLDFSVLAPAPSNHASKIDVSKFIAGRQPATGWNAKVGVDNRPPPSPSAALQPDLPLPGATPTQSNGVAWANVTAPGLASPWAKAAIETRIDPQEQSKLGMTLSRSVPVGGNASVTLQNGYSVMQSLPSGSVPALAGAAPAATPGSAPAFGSNHAVRLNILPLDTTFSVGAAASGNDEKWLRSLSAEQKLFGGPVSVTGSVRETASGETSKSLKAGFKRTW